MLFGAATLLLVGCNWDVMPAAVKLAIVFSLMVVTNGASKIAASRSRPVFCISCFGPSFATSIYSAKWAEC